MTRSAADQDDQAPGMPHAFDEGILDEIDALSEADRLQRLERLVRVQATHHEHLVRQIAELTVAMYTMRQDIPKLVAEGVVLAVGDPRAWEAGRQAMRTRADKVVVGAFWSALAAIWDKARWGVVGLVLLWALRGPDFVFDLARMLWRGH